MTTLQSAWDALVSRVVPGAFFALIFFAKATSFYRFNHLPEDQRAAMGELAYFSSLVYQVLLMGFLGLVVILFVVRSAPIRKAGGIRPRLLALAGAFILSAVAAMPIRPISWPIDVAASVLLVFGTAIMLLALAHLGRCFSIMPEVRGVVMSGPYRYVRHPMYLGEFASGLGMVLASLTWQSVAIYLIFIWLQIRRIDYEEHGLRDYFPRYDAYVSETKRLIPWVY